MARGYAKVKDGKLAALIVASQGSCKVFNEVDGWIYKYYNRPFTNLKDGIYRFRSVLDRGRLYVTCGKEISSLRREAERLAGRGPAKKVQSSRPGIAVPGRGNYTYHDLAQAAQSAADNRVQETKELVAALTEWEKRR